MRVFDVADDGALTGGGEFAKCTNGGFDGFRLDEDGRIWTSAGDGVHVYDPDGTLIGKVLVPGDRRQRRLGLAEAQPALHLRDDFAVRDLASGAPERRRCSHDRPPHPLPDAAAGRGGGPARRRQRHDAGARPRGRQAARGGAGDRRAAVQLPPLGRRPGGSTPQLLEQGERDASRAACSTGRSASWTSTSPTARRPRAPTTPKLIELLDATERGGRAHRRRHGAHRGGPRASPDRASCTASRAASISARRRRRSTAHVHELADRGVLYITLAHLFWRRVATNAPALPVPPRRALQPRSSRRTRARRSPSSARPRCEAMYERKVLVDISHMRDDAIDETFALIEALDRETGRDPRAYPVIASHAGYRFGGQKYNLSDRTIVRHRRPRRRGRADLRPAPDQRRPAAHGHRRRWPSRSAMLDAPHRRDRPAARRARLRPRRLHQADARRDRDRRRPRAAGRGAARRATPPRPMTSWRATRGVSSTARFA